MEIDEIMTKFEQKKKINNVSEIYKGDGITTCRRCGNTGLMHTFSNDGYFYDDVPCICDLGRNLLKKGE